MKNKISKGEFDAMLTIGEINDQDFFKPIAKKLKGVIKDTDKMEAMGKKEFAKAKEKFKAAKTKKAKQKAKIEFKSAKSKFEINNRFVKSNRLTIARAKKAIAILNRPSPKMAGLSEHKSVMDEFIN